MNITMFTNTFVPHVGGVANSVKLFTDGYRKCGHHVLVIAPKYKNMPLPDEKDVVRVPAIQNFHGSDFSVSLPIPMNLSKKLAHFHPDIIHSHHPFLLGDSALRSAAARNVPLVFTYHTMYEQYTHYIPGNSSRIQRFVEKLSIGYANLCDHIIAPSESVAIILKKRGVKTAITVIPTGVDIDSFSQADNAKYRFEMGIPENAFVVGYLGRLVREKNLQFWAAVVTGFMKQYPTSHVLMIGDGPLKKRIGDIFTACGVRDRLHFDGILRENKLASAYQAMDVFVFTSKSETQGIVLIEAMAAGVPVVALDAPGVREVVRDNENGRLLKEENVRMVIEAILWIASMNTTNRNTLKNRAKKSALKFSIHQSITQALDLYHYLIDKKSSPFNLKKMNKYSLLRKMIKEWHLWYNRLSAGFD